MRARYFAVDLDLRFDCVRIRLFELIGLVAGSVVHTDSSVFATSGPSTIAASPAMQ